MCLLNLYNIDEVKKRRLFNRSINSYFIYLIVLFYFKGNVYQQLDNGDDTNEGTPLLN